MPTFGVLQEYSSWLTLWKVQTKFTPGTNNLPTAARKVTTPLKPDAWLHMLATHPEQNLVKFFIDGITQGFRIGFNYQSTPIKSAKINMDSANLHPAIVTEYLQTELNQNRIAGPFTSTTWGGGHISRFGVIPKNNQSGVS